MTLLAILIVGLTIAVLAMKYVVRRSGGMTLCTAAMFGTKMNRVTFAAQKDLPKRPEAIRRLVEIGPEG